MYNQNINKKKGGNERTETAACAGCTAAQILVGFAPDMNYLTLACISNVTALAY